MSEHSQEDLDSSLVELDAKLPSLVTIQNAFWKSTTQFQALLSETGVPNGVKPTSAARRFTPSALTYLRIIYLHGDNPGAISKDVTVTIKEPGKQPYKVTLSNNKSYAYGWIRNFCEWVEISSTASLLKPTLKKIEFHGSTTDQLTLYKKDIEDVIELKTGIEDYKINAKAEYAETINQIKLLEAKVNELQEETISLASEKDAIETDISLLSEHQKDIREKIQKSDLELSYFHTQSIIAKNNREQLTEQNEALNKNIANLSSQLQKLTNDRNLISDEYGPYVNEGNNQATIYSFLVLLPLLAIIFSTYQVYVGASNLLSTEYKSSTDVLAAFILRIPFAAIFGLAILYSWKLANAMIQKIFKIHGDRLTLAKLLVVARETVHSSAKNLKISDHEKFQEQTALKIEVLKSHMARDLNENFTYIPIPSNKTTTIETPNEAVNDDVVDKEPKSSS